MYCRGENKSNCSVFTIISVFSISSNLWVTPTAHPNSSLISQLGEDPEDDGVEGRKEEKRGLDRRTEDVCW